MRDATSDAARGVRQQEVVQALHSVLPADAVLGVLVWEARHDPRRLERVAWINAATELVDAAAATMRGRIDHVVFAGALTHVHLTVGDQAMQAMVHSPTRNRPPRYSHGS